MWAGELVDHVDNYDLIDGHTEQVRYVNRCGFHIVEYFNEHHCAPDDKDGELFDMFRFEKNSAIHTIKRKTKKFLKKL